jgi:purine nucleosidase
MHARSRKPVKPKLILDTDIGTDVDDAFALLFALGSSEFDLAAVTLVHARLDVRAQIALKILKMAGRLDVAVAAGCSETLTPNGRMIWAGHEGTETDFSDVTGLRAAPDGVEHILRLVRENPGQAIVAPVGPLTNIATAIVRDPETMRLVRRLVIMASVFKGSGRDRAAVEHNACVDSDATAIVLRSGLPITLVGLNVTLQTALTSERMSAMRGTPLGDYAANMAQQFIRLGGRQATCMHDPLAVAIAARPDIAVTRRLRAVAVPDIPGAVEFSEAVDGESAIDVVVDIDVPAFEEMFFSRIERVVGSKLPA